MGVKYLEEAARNFINEMAITADHLKNAGYSLVDIKKTGLWGDRKSSEFEESINKTLMAISTNLNSIDSTKLVLKKAVEELKH